MTEETKVKFSLWAVLGFLVLIAAILFGDLYLGQRSIQAKSLEMNQAVCTRVTILEESFKAIREDSKDIKAGLKEVVAAVNKHELTTAAALRVKSWNAPENR